MIRNQRGKMTLGQIVAAVALVMAGTLIGTAQIRSRQGGLQGPDPGRFPESDPTIVMSRKQQKALLKHKFEGMKKDADEMAELAKLVQEDLNKATENELPLRVADKAEKIEKLAKRIKNTAKGN